MFGFTHDKISICEQPATLYDLIFTVLVGMASDQDSFMRFTAFDAMYQWIGKVQVVQTFLRQSDVTSQKVLLDERRREKLVSLVWDSWRDPVEAVQHKVKHCFQALLKALQAQCDEYISKEELQKFTDRLLERVLNVDWREKVTSS
jgi:hypothetical protein